MSNKYHTSQYPAEEPKNDVHRKFFTYVKDLQEDELKTTRDQLRECEVRLSEAEINVEMRRAQWQKALSLQGEYQIINEEIGIKIQQLRVELTSHDPKILPASETSDDPGISTETEGNIEQAIAQYDELKSYFDGTVACIKDLQQELLGVVSAAQALKNAKKDPCNVEDVNQIEKDISDLEAQITNICRCADEACNESVENFEAGVMSSGLGPLTNPENGMQRLGNEIAKNVDLLTVNIDTNLDTAEEHVIQKRADYDAAIKDWCKAQDDCAVLATLLDGYTRLKDFAAPDHTRSKPTTMEQLLKQAEKNFDYQVVLENIE